MDELQAVAPVLDLGATGVLLAAVWWFSRYFIRMISSGEWVSRRELDYLRADRDARLAEKDEEIQGWRDVASTERTRGDIAVEQNRDLVAGFGTVNRALDALRAMAAEGARHVDDDAPI